MSFGYGAGDFFTVIQLAWNLSKACIEAPKHFQDISNEVRSLQDVLKDTEEVISAGTVFLGPEKEDRLRTIIGGCYAVLKDLEAQLKEFSSLGTNNKRAFDRLRWSQEEVVALRGRIISHIVMLNDFKTSLQLSSDRALEKKVDLFIQEIRAARGAGPTDNSVATTIRTAGSLISATDTQDSRRQAPDASQSPMRRGGQTAPRHTPTPVKGGLVPRKLYKLFVSKETKTELMTAARADDVLTVQKLVKKGLDVDYQTEDGETALIAAAQAGSHKVLHWLLKHGADTALVTATGMNALQVGCFHSRQLAAQLLLEFGADIDARTTNHAQTALHLAVEGGGLEVVRLLVEKGASINAVSDGGLTALAHAIVKRNTPIVRYLLEMGTHIRTDDFHKAIQIGDPDLVRMFLDHGADISTFGYGEGLEDGVVDPSGKRTSTAPLHGFAAVHVACRAGKVEVARMLLDDGADATTKTEKGYTTLHLACFSGNIELVRLLLGHGVEVEAKTNDGSTALHVAARYGQISTRQTVVQLLLDRGININAAMHGGKTAIHLAALNADDAVLEFLLSRGADVMAKCDEGRSPLHYAASATGIDAETKAKRMIKLLQHGADISATDNLGKTALEYVRDDGTAQRISQWRKTKNKSRARV